MDDQSKCTIQILEDILRANASEFGGNWDRQIPLKEFTDNNNYQSSIDMAPFEALYGRKCKTPIYWKEARERKLLDLQLV